MDPKIVLPLLNRAAHAAIRNQPSYVLQEDVYGELVVWLYQRKSSIQKLIDEHPESWQQQLFSTALKAATSYASKERAAVEGSPEAGYLYSMNKIKDLLPDAFDYEDWQTFGKSGDGQPRGKAIVSHGNTRAAELIDIKIALEKLPSETQQLLELYYGQGLTMPVIANHLGLNLETAKKRAQRALTALQKALGKRDRLTEPERRTVRSNAAWQAATSHDYSGD